MWALADDIEHVLAHRDVRDWYVFEAASWALAEQRMPAERRRELWLEPLPAAELAGRLRRLPLFASVSVDELFRIAGAARQVRHEPGTRPAEGRDGARHACTCCSTAGSTAPAAADRRRDDRAAGRARLRRGAAGPADARDDPDRRRSR